MQENGMELILKELKAMNEKITAIETNMATKEDLESINLKIDSISKQVVKNAEDISVIKDNQEKETENYTEALSVLNNLATKDDLDYLDKKVGEHDGEIFKI
ncbi:hypothetical protein [Oceanobacillus indicireducens]|uniref:Uncharacterized protein n=1 Tax=Oceanobacillus indicireducens TaxID=1004261 RepID=A0A917XR34_9BACI|nr:hypothetical protein [Oceanobacillus indicireducens]GGN49563.1 hypothetical protein GCM10007971_02240 [Oceanobacillus indicireducens]